MPGISLISTKRPSAGYGGGAALVLLALCAAAPGAEPDRDARIERDRDAIIEQARDRMFRMDYPAAESLLLEGLPAAAPAQPYFAAMICLNRFLDWGDTAALGRAERFLERLSPRDGGEAAGFPGTDAAELRLYRGLAGFQQSYLASLRGQRLRPAALAVAARRQLLPLDRPEARATLILYDYYRDRMLGKLPFVDAAEFPLAEFRAAIDAAPLLRDMFLFSLFWVHLDNRRTGPALQIAETFLARYPDNRLAREMRGDALHRAGRHTEARAAYESLREEYAGLKKGLPLGYYRAVGNLARIDAALGLKAEARARLAEWNRAGLSGAGPWLPASLKRDLADL